MKKSKSYTYNIEAAQARLRRGQKSVLLRFPYAGLVERITKRNVNTAARRYHALASTMPVSHTTRH